jgi:hypothetical protein
MTTPARAQAKPPTRKLPPVDVRHRVVIMLTKGSFLGSLRMGAGGTQHQDTLPQ